jgi:hypothetical protein
MWSGIFHFSSCQIYPRIWVQTEIVFTIMKKRRLYQWVLSPCRHCTECSWSKLTAYLFPESWCLVDWNQGIYTYKNGRVCVCVCVCMFKHNSGTSVAISTKLDTHIAICMCKNLMNVLYIYLCPNHQFPKGIWMIHVEEIKLLLLPGNHMVMTSRLTTVGQTYPCKHIVSAKM